ncbi:MAG: SH3 domain-containing protein [Sphaerochaeta sp.]|jgi:hypothetical protein|nr:SH3 domain-containing protein [Sphaerochaeta sp.]
MTYKDFPIRLADVSENQDNPGTAKVPNLDKIIEAGFLGIGVRCAYGIVKDKMFDTFWASGKGRIARLNYLYGDYYSYKQKSLTPVQWGIMQGQNWHELTKSDPGEIPAHLDCEESVYGGRYTILNKDLVTTIYRNILTEHDRLSGGFDGIYTVPGHLWIFGDWFKDRPLWLAWYDRTKTLQQILAAVAKYKWRGPVTIWQYASDGDINDDAVKDGLTLGMETKDLDLSVFIKNGGSLEEWSKYCGSTPAPAATTVEDLTPEIVTAVTHPTKTVEIMTVQAMDGILNIRNEPHKPSNVIGYIKNGKQVEVLETIISGQDLWARVGQGQYCAIRYNGIDYLI